VDDHNHPSTSASGVLLKQDILSNNLEGKNKGTKLGIFCRKALDLLSSFAMDLIN
jgi:hypothetical protein